MNNNNIITNNENETSTTFGFNTYFTDSYLFRPFGMVEIDNEKYLKGHKGSKKDVLQYLENLKGMIDLKGEVCKEWEAKGGIFFSGTAGIEAIDREIKKIEATA